MKPYELTIDGIRRAQEERARARRRTGGRNNAKLVKCCEREAFEDEGRHGLDCPRQGAA